MRIVQDMYVHVRKSGNNRYVYIMESYRNSEGKVAHRTIEKLGRYDVLLKKDPLFLEKLRNNLRLRDKFPRYDNLEQENLWLEQQGLNTEAPEENSLAYSGMPVYVYSNRVLRHIFRKILNLEYMLSYMQSQSSESFDFTLSTLIYHRILAKFFSGSDCVQGTLYTLIGDSFDLKDEHAYLMQVRTIIGSQQERILSYMLKKASQNANFPEIAVALGELNATTLNNFLTSLNTVRQDEKNQLLLEGLQPFLARLTPHPARADLSGQSFLNEFEALVTKAMLEIIRKALLKQGTDYSLTEIERALTRACMTVYIPPYNASDTLYIKLSNSYTGLNNQILSAFGFEAPLSCSRKNDLQRALKIKYCSNREILGDAVYERFVIPDPSPDQTC